MKKILFICAGNTCRSPMAEMLLKHKLAKKGDLTADIASAGLQVFTKNGINASTQKVLSENGIAVCEFRSKEITVEMIMQADYAFCMTLNHKKMLKNYENVYTLDEFTGCGEIADPYGCGIEVYRKVFETLDKSCDELIKKIDWQS